MITTQPSQILEEFKNFVHTSCVDCSDTRFSSLHKGIIKMYFGARKVDIDYENKMVMAEIPISDHQYTMVNFECQDLDRFLTSCIKKDKRSLNFYQNALNYYSFLKVA